MITATITVDKNTELAERFRVALRLYAEMLVAIGEDDIRRYYADIAWALELSSDTSESSSDTWTDLRAIQRQDVERLLDEQLPDMLRRYERRQALVARRQDMESVIGSVYGLWGQLPPEVRQAMKHLGRSPRPVSTSEFLDGFEQALKLVADWYEQNREAVELQQQLEDRTHLLEERRQRLMTSCNGEPAVRVDPQNGDVYGLFARLLLQGVTLQRVRRDPELLGRLEQACDMLERVTERFMRQVKPKATSTGTPAKRRGTPSKCKSCEPSHDSNKQHDQATGRKKSK